MKKHYQRVSNAMLALVPEDAILTSSIVEVDAEVTVEEYKDGFSDLGDEGFVVEFE